MTRLAPKYSFKEVEKGRYKIWKEKGYFKAVRSDAKPFTIVIPPPNVTGRLHLGHAWDNTIQDIIIRRKRMQGYSALYLPGSDHAGIATQARVDEKLRGMGISSFEIGREKFLEYAWDWKEEYENHIFEQWEEIGISVDYDRYRFTLDNKLNEAVNHVFIKLYNDGLIYRGNRIINWDPQAQTALSNIEVEHVDQTAKLYYLRYPIKGSKEYLVVATTRPETMFADQAVMVNPNDDRFKHLVGKTVLIPGTKVEIPVIADDYVEMDFGTGIVKVTPAHDPNDFEVGERHNLEMPLCMNEDGTMNEMAFDYEGLDRFECRKQLLKDLEKINLLEKIEDYETSIGYSERTGVVVEPRLSLQWFLKMEELSNLALTKSEAEFVPKRFERTFTNWMTDTRDWTLSRQLWWGHRIPAWYKGDEVKVQVESPGKGWVQDEDVLDTWFSSALWPFSTLGWPEETEDFKYFYPTNVMVTGYDIIFFWVARMIFQGLYFTKETPFKHVLLHGLIRDSQGRKMSKSLDNGVDPIDVINKYGSDSLRYFLTTNSAPGADLRYDETKVESSWNFINKLWNISRFVLMNTNIKEADEFIPVTLSDKWIINRLYEVIDQADYYYEKFDLNEASRILYHFIWDEFAAWYVEFSKIDLQDDALKATTENNLLFVLKAILKMMHPFIPFVTEELYIEATNEETIVTSKWPTSNKVNKKDIEVMVELQDLITKVRNLRSENQIAPSKQIDINILYKNIEFKEILLEFKTHLEKFLGALNLNIIDSYDKQDESFLILGTNADLYILKEDLIDVEKEKEALLNEKKRLEGELNRSRNILSNEKFLQRAPQVKVDEEKKKLKNYETQYETLLKNLKKYV